MPKTSHTQKQTAKPFLKWAGGKSQLLNEIEKVVPKNKDDYLTYIEPFVGGGAVLFRMLKIYPNIEKAVINDINSDLIITYRTIKDNLNTLITILQKWEAEYHKLLHYPEDKKAYYYKKRDIFNSGVSDNITHSALMIFLNKTCFNGLYRVNRKNKFNVPVGSYKNPLICDTENLNAVSNALQKVEILNGDFTETLQYANTESLFYLDPPYKPLSNTSSFNSYARDVFNDEEQIRLKQFCDKLDKQGHKWILNNSDLKGNEPENNFFDNLYKDYTIRRIQARRSINSKGDKRGKLNELLITNYTYEHTPNEKNHVPNIPR